MYDRVIWPEKYDPNANHLCAQITSTGRHPLPRRAAGPACHR
jgi:hypothetical protein